jgi:hypothetical protein
MLGKGACVKSATVLDGTRKHSSLCLNYLCSCAKKVLAIKPKIIARLLSIFRKEFQDKK